jgi:benzylsuccinate CoA-transferase BbsE subunit
MPLQGVRVLELATDASGEMAGLQLVHLGATVTKLEPPEGAPSRHTGPFVNDVVDAERSIAFWYYNGGKRSVVLDLARVDGRRRLDRLLRGHDVFISTLHPTELGSLAIDLTEISSRNPALVVVSITPFGLTGPWAHYKSSDLVALATSGLLITSGYDDHDIPPIRPGGNQALHTAASFAGLATMLALINRNSSGVGGLIDVSIQEAAGVTVELANPYWFYPRGLVQRQTCRHAQPVPTQPAIFQCSDGRWIYFALILADERPWEALVAWMDGAGMAVDLVDPKYSDLTYRQANFAHVQDLVECFFLVQTSDSAFHDGQSRGLPIGILNAPEDLYLDEHLRQRDYFVPVDQPGFGVVERPVAAYRFSHLDTARPAPAPRLGEDDDSIQNEIE